MCVTGRRAAEEAPHRRAVLDIAEVVGEVVQASSIPAPA